MHGPDLTAHAGFLRRLAGSLLADDHLAQDAVQEAYAAALRDPGARNVRAWLAGVVRNVSLRMLRREAGRRRAERGAACPETLPSAETLAASAETQQRVAQAVSGLDDPYRSAVLLRYFHDLSPTEIARRTGEPLATVKTRLRRALARLRERLDETHGGDRRAWSVALLPILARRSAAPGILGGIALMKTKLLAVAAVLALVAFIAGTRAWRSGPGSASRSQAVAASEPLAAEGATPAATLPPATADVGRDTDAEAVSADERERYREWRRVAPVFAASRRSLGEARAFLAELGAAEEETPPQGDPATAGYLQDLVRAYRAAAPGADRLKILQQIVATHAKYLGATHDASFLPFLEDVIRGSDVAEERELAVPEAGEETLSLLLRLLGHADPNARAAVIRSLAGSEDSSAVEAVVRGLSDPASAVRWSAAIELEYTIADPAHVAALLGRLPLESHPLAADGMVRAIVALDSEGGARRVEDAVEKAPAAVRAAVLSALRAPEPAESDAAPGNPVEEEPAPDAVTGAYLQRLLQEYRALEGRERLAALEKLAHVHADYLERTADASFLSILAEIARTSPVVGERVAVVGSFRAARDRRVVDLVIELKGNREAAVRGAVAAALAWVRGEETARARRELLGLLADPAPSVRVATALLLAVPVADPGNVARLLEALRNETDVVAAYAMIDAVIRLDPEGGRGRVESAASEVPAARPVIEAALRLRDERK